MFLLELIGVRVFKLSLNKGRVPRTKTIHVQPSIKPKKVDALSQTKPQLPDQSLAPGIFVKTAIKDLLDAGYIFTDEQIKLFGSIEGSKIFTTRKLPLFWLLKDGETRSCCDPNTRRRYWKEEFISGKYRFLMYSQWYEDSNKGATKQHFINWYESL